VTGALRYSVSGTLSRNTITVRGNPSTSNMFYRPDDCAPYNSPSPPPPFDNGPVFYKGGFVGANGHYFVAYQQVQESWVSDTRCSLPILDGLPIMGKYTYTSDVYVLELAADGPVGTVPLAHFTDSVGATVATR